MQYPHEFNVLAYTTTKDPNTGEETKGYATEFTAEGEVVALTGLEQMEAMKLDNPIDYQVTLDYDSRVKPKKRIQMGEIVLDIHAALPTLPDFNGDYEQMILKCSSSLR